MISPSLLFAAALSMTPAAPVPKPVPPSGPAPYLATFPPVKDGKVTIAVLRTEKESITVIEVINGGKGDKIAVPVTREVEITRSVRVDLLDVKDLQIITAGGTAVGVKDAAKRLADGGTVVVSADGKKVDAAFLALLKDDTLVFASPELMPAKSTVRPADEVRHPPLLVKPGSDRLNVWPGSEKK